MSDIQKVCRGCGELLPLNSFPTDSNRPDGHRAQCRACKSKYDREHRKIVDPAHTRELHRSSRKNHPEKLAARRRRFRKNHPDKNRAHRMIYKAVRCGRIVKSEICQCCGVSENIEAHHQDYEKPLSVIWLCRGCHRSKHKEG